MGVRTSDPLNLGYRGSDVLTLGALTQAGLLYATAELPPEATNPGLAEG